MSGTFALASFLAHWHRSIRHDLSASEAETLSLSALLAMADDADLQRWQQLGLGYAHPQGVSWLRSTIAERHPGLAADDVLCCAGAQEALTCVVRALLAPGDHAIVVVPIYQPSEQAVTAVCAATGVPLTGVGGWHLDVQRIAEAVRPETRLVLMNFPNSPTGASIDAATLDAMVALCRQHGLWLINDEVYRLTDESPQLRPPQVADIYERGVSINGMSKSFGLPGLRVGWAVCRDRRMLAEAQAEKSLLSSCLGGPSEVLAHIALRAEARIIARNRDIARANRNLLQSLIRRFPDLFDWPASSTMAFAFPRYRGGEGAEHFAARLARDAGVLLLPASLWRSPLAEMPLDRVRIGLGRAGVAEALAAVEDHLIRSPRLAAMV